MAKKTNLLGTDSLANKLSRVKKELDHKKLKDVSEKAKCSKDISVKEKKAVNPKLYVSGRLNRKNNIYVAKSLFLSKNIEDDIKTYCRGGELPILNYLIRTGLSAIKASKSTINADMKDIEENDTT